MKCRDLGRSACIPKRTMPGPETYADIIDTEVRTHLFLPFNSVRVRVGRLGVVGLQK